MTASRPERAVAIIGLGYVGLPLAAAFAEAGLSVVGVDADEAKIAVLEGGGSYIEDMPAGRLGPLISSGARRLHLVAAGALSGHLRTF